MQDCRDVEAIVKDTFDGANKPKAVIVWLEREDWRRPDNEARTKWNVQNIPTILRLQDVSLVKRVGVCALNI